MLTWREVITRISFCREGCLHLDYFRGCGRRHRSCYIDNSQFAIGGEFSVDQLKASQQHPGSLMDCTNLSMATLVSFIPNVARNHRTYTGSVRCEQRKEQERYTLEAA